MMRTPQWWAWIMIAGLLVGLAPGAQAGSSKATVGIQIIMPPRDLNPPTADAGWYPQDARTFAAASEQPSADPDMERSTTMAFDGKTTILLVTDTPRL